MAYSTVAIDSAMSTEYVESSHNLARASDGRLWAVYHTDNRRYIKVRYSDDDGATWSAATTVKDWGTGTQNLSYTIKIGADDNPIIASYKDLGSGADIEFHRWNGSSWSLQSAHDCGTSPPSPYWGTGLVQSSTGRWWMIYANGSTTTSSLILKYSDDACATWSAGQTIYTGPATSAMFRLYRGSYNMICDSTDTLHFLWSDYRTAAGKHSVYYDSADVSADPSTVTLNGTTNWDNEGSFSANDLPPRFSLAEDGDGHIHASWVAVDTAGGTSRLYYNQYNGSWGTVTKPDSTYYTARGTLIVGTDNIPTFVAIGGASGGTLNLYRYTATSEAGTSWNSRALIDSGATYFIADTSAQYTSGLEFTRLASGVAFYAQDDTNADAEFWYENPVWSEGAIPTKSVSNDFTMSGEIVLPDYPNTVTPYWNVPVLGGRCFTRDSNGNQWFAAQGAYSGSSLYAFGRASGASRSSWTITTVATDTYDAVAQSLDDVGRPWYLAHKVGASNIKVFAWNGTQYVQNASISTGHSTISSFECWYDGTLYHMVYPHKKSNGKWRLLHRTSTDVTDSVSRWSSPTEVWLTDNTTNDYSMRSERRISGMMDSAGDFHLIASAMDGGTFKIVPFTYDKSAGTWSTGSAFVTSGSVHPRGLSTAVDIDDAVHHAYLASGILGYATNTSGSYVVTLPTLDGTLHGYPSMGFRRSGTVPIIAVANEDNVVGEWVYSGGTWSWKGIYTGSVSYDAITPHLLYDRLRNYQRATFGIAFVIEGSTIYVGSAYIQWDDEAEAEDTNVTFSQEIAIKGLVYPENDFEVSQTQTFVRDHEVAGENDFEVDQILADPRREFPRSNIDDDADVVMRQYLAVSINGEHYRSPLHNVGLGHIVGVTKRQNLGATHTLTFTGDIRLTINKTVPSGVDFDQEIDLIKYLTKSIANALEVDQVILKTGIWNRGVTHSLTFSSNGISIRDWNAYDTDLAIAAWPTYEDSVMQVVFQWPAALPTESVTFMRPNFGDTRVDSRRTGSVRRNRTGRARVYKVPVYSTFNLEWRGIPRHVGENWRQHMVKWLGSAIRYQDHNGIWHECVVTDTDLTRTQNGPEFNTFRLSLQKTERVDLSPSTVG